MRLQTYIKNNANKTKREVIDLYHQGLILVNGKIIPLPNEVSDTDIVTLNGEIVKPINYVYYLYNKPIGIECTNDLNKKNNIREHLNLDLRVYTVGRLDKNSHGLIILTNDNMFCHEIVGKHNYEKEYIVKTKETIDNKFIDNIQKSVLIKDKMTKECKAYLIDDNHFGIILNEGMYHQIRKMVIMNNNTVMDLKRVRIGNIKLDDYKLDNDCLIKIDNLKELI